MEQRILGRTGRPVSVIGLGTWQLGADWGQVDEKDALAVLDAAAESGVTFLDTADVYGDGRSERLIGQFVAANPGLPVTVATKMIQQPGVTTVIPGARSPEQARQNASAAGLPPLSAGQLGAIEDLYDRRIRALVQDRW